MLRKLRTGWKAVRQLGLEQVGLYGIYKAGLWLGVWNHDRSQKDLVPGSLAIWWDIAELQESYRGWWSQRESGAQALLDEAGEILKGRVRLFGGPPVALELAPPGPLAHWTAYERGQAHLSGDPDYKLVWEPARFGWAYTLARAYALSGNQDYAQCFWDYFERFDQANPVNRGPNWVSAQEVALRLMALVFAGNILVHSPASTPARQARLAETIAQHGARIPPTLLYARSQNNNHLITEALGLYTAGSKLPGLAQARHWKALGWKWLNRAFQQQIDADGSYAQHSANYHRLMLQAALLAQWAARKNGESLPVATLEKLAAATRWLLAQLDPISGRVPNLGSNDGAMILPLGGGAFEDYRGTAQAAAKAFLGGPVLAAGEWDELGWWLGLDEQVLEGMQTGEPKPSGTLAGVIRPSAQEWGSIRAVHYHSRPSHADPLHVELWWQGENIAMDAGTFRYTAAPPWDNALASTLVHNTITVDGREAMTRAGRFLWLDWAHSRWLRHENGLVEAEQDGYRRLGVIHRRQLSWLGAGRWQVVDTLAPLDSQGKVHAACLHWLLPDWPYQLQETTLSLRGPVGPVRLSISLPGEFPAALKSVDLVRAGVYLTGKPNSTPILGWRSPTYNVRLPALSLRLQVEGRLPIVLVSTFEMG